MKDKRAMAQHLRGKVAHSRFGLDVEVAEHFIAPPPTDQANSIGVNLGAKQSHGASGAKGSSRHVRSKETKFRAEEHDGELEDGGNVAGGDMRPASMRKICSKRSGRISTVGPSMQDPVAQADNRTEVGVARTAKPDNFATDPIFLSSES